MSAHQTEIHDTHTCPCEMCVWARQTAANKPKLPSEAYYGHFRLDTGRDLAVEGAGNPQPDPQDLFRGSEGVASPQTPNSTIPVPTFTEEWESAPRWATRTTEIESAQYWFLRGGQAKEIELTGVINEDLKEIRRVAGERLQR